MASLAAGAFNKLYLIKSSSGAFIMRVLLPVYPTYKTRSEVSTISWLRQKTSIPVPAIIAFDDSRHNALGYDWILMEMMPETTLYQRWRTMPMEDKEKVVKAVAGYQAELLQSKNECRGTGNLCRVAKTPPSPTKIGKTRSPAPTTTGLIGMLLDIKIII